MARSRRAVTRTEACQCSPGGRISIQPGYITGSGAAAPVPPLQSTVKFSDAALDSGLWLTDPACSAANLKGDRSERRPAGWIQPPSRRKRGLFWPYSPLATFGRHSSAGSSDRIRLVDAATVQCGSVEAQAWPAPAIPAVCSSCLMSENHREAFSNSIENEQEDAVPRSW